MHLLAARELGVRPEECLAIEDSPAGVRAALVAGSEVVAVTAEITRQKFRDTELLDRSHVVDDPRTLPGVVRRLTDAHRQTQSDKGSREKKGERIVVGLGHSR